MKRENKNPNPNGRQGLCEEEKDHKILILIKEERIRNESKETGKDGGGNSYSRIRRRRRGRRSAEEEKRFRDACKFRTKGNPLRISPHFPSYLILSLLLFYFSFFLV